MNTFLPYPNFEKSAKCLDYRRLGKQRVETWQIYNILKQGEYSICPNCVGIGENSTYSFQKCKKCKTFGKIKTPWYKHPCVQMWKGYENCLLLYGIAICEEWIKRGYKDTTLGKFELALAHFKIEKLRIPLWLGNEKFHSVMRANLLRKDPKWYGQFGWNEVPLKEYFWGEV